MNKKSCILPSVQILNGKTVLQFAVWWGLILYMAQLLIWRLKLFSCEVNGWKLRIVHHCNHFQFMLNWPIFSLLYGKPRSAGCPRIILTRGFDATSYRLDALHGTIQQKHTVLQFVHPLRLLKGKGRHHPFVSAEWVSRV